MSFLFHVDWLGIAGLFIAIGALVQSRKALQQSEEQMRQNQRHVELSVRPLLTGHYTLLTDQLLAIDIENRGLGPAVISRWDVWSEDSPDDVFPIEKSTHLDQFLTSKMPNPKPPFVSSLKKRGTYLPAGSNWRLFELGSPSSLGDAQFVEMVKRAVKRISIRIEFESIYGESFVETVSDIKQA